MAAGAAKNVDTSTRTGSQAGTSLLGFITLWLVSVFLLLGGILVAITGARDGWWNEVVTGVLTAAGAVLLAPPVIEKLGRRWPRLRPMWVPLLFLVALLAIPSWLARPLAPDANEQRVLRKEALLDARKFMAVGEFQKAKARISRFAKAPDPDGAVAAITAKLRHAGNEVPGAKSGGAGVQSTSAKQAAPANFPDPAVVYVERVQEYWLPEVQSLPASAPAGGPDFGALLTRLEYFRSLVADGEALSLTPKQGAVLEDFKAAVRTKQRALYPSFRRQYAEMLRAQMFRNDVDVSAAGEGARTLRLTGPIFVRNANIEDTQQALASALERMRIARTEYRWSRHGGTTTYYDLKPPADGDLR